MAFQKGVSGNPKGRPAGQTHKALRAQIAAAAPDIIAKLIESAKGGDSTAARLLLDRLMPVYRAVDQAQALPLGADKADLAGASQAVLEGLARGALTPDQAASVAVVLANLTRVQESVELADRVAALEKAKP